MEMCSSQSSSLAHPITVAAYRVPPLIVGTLPETITRSFHAGCAPDALVVGDIDAALNVQFADVVRYSRLHPEIVS